MGKGLSDIIPDVYGSIGSMHHPTWVAYIAVLSGVGIENV